MRPTTTGLVAIVLLSTGCSGKANQEGAAADSTVVVVAPGLPPGEAFLPVADGRVWYHKVGTGSGIPVILLHGGPGYSSYYLKLFEKLGDDRTVVRYDQSGSGKSGTLTDTTKMNVARFVAELDSLRSHLGYERVHILGHSWGTILGFEYYRAHPERVASLTLASPALDFPAWAKNAKDLLTTISDSGQRAVAEAEKSGNYATPAYEAANGEFWAKYVMRSSPEPVQADLDSLLAQVNLATYSYMQGPSEFTIVGTLKDYDATPHLNRVTVPVLFTVGEFDEANPKLVRRQAALVPGAKVEVIKGAAHATPWDGPDQSLAVVRAFLRAADRSPK